MAEAQFLVHVTQNRWEFPRYQKLKKITLETRELHFTTKVTRLCNTNDAETEMFYDGEGNL